MDKVFILYLVSTGCLFMSTIKPSTEKINLESFRVYFFYNLINFIWLLGGYPFVLDYAIWCWLQIHYSPKLMILSFDCNDKLFNRMTQVFSKCRIRLALFISLEPLNSSYNSITSSSYHCFNFPSLCISNPDRESSFRVDNFVRHL